MFTKIDADILDSSLWQLPASTRIVWITMLAMADHQGVVRASLGGLARRANVTREEAEKAIQTFLGPDADSRDRTTGERIRHVESGWVLINWTKFQEAQANYGVKSTNHNRQRTLKVKTTILGVGKATTGLDSPSDDHWATSGQDSLPIPTNIHEKNQDPTCDSTACEQVSTEFSTKISVPSTSGTQSTQSTEENIRERESVREREVKIPVISKPVDIPDGLWSDWLAHRKARKAPVTPTVLKMMAVEAQKAGKTLQEALETTIYRGWIGYKAEWDRDDSRGFQSPYKRKNLSQTHIPNMPLGAAGCSCPECVAHREKQSKSSSPYNPNL